MTNPIELPAVDSVDERSVGQDPGFRPFSATRLAPVRVVATDAHEGPVYVKSEDALYFMTFPSDRGARPGLATLTARLWPRGESSILRAGVQEDDHRDH